MYEDKLSEMELFNLEKQKLRGIFSNLIVIYAWQTTGKTEPDSSLSWAMIGQEEMWTNWDTRNSI